MDFVSIDIETTGISPELDQILEFGAVIVKDWKIVDSFRKTIYHERISGSPYALNLNHELIGEISNCKDIFSNDNFETLDFLAESFYSFCKKHFKLKENKININVAGKNFGSFDLQFLKRVPKWDEYFKINHRYLDPAILYFDIDLDKDSLPDLKKCKERSGLFTDIEVKHRADIDAEETAILIIHKLKR
jgi:DNA polymerase III epsilon subunit-like protein